MIKKVSTQKASVSRGDLVKAAAPVDCMCGCDAPGCVDWISQGIAIIGGAASDLFL